MHWRGQSAQRGPPVSTLMPHAHKFLSGQQIWEPWGPQVRPWVSPGAQGPVLGGCVSCDATGAGTATARRAERSSQAAMCALQ
jgi:hypothetical protein